MMCVLEGLDDLSIGISSNGKPFKTISGSQFPIGYCCGYGPANLTDGWNRHCFTFKSAGDIKVIKINLN